MFLDRWYISYFYFTNLYMVHPVPCIYVLVINGQCVSRTVWTICLAFSRVALTRLGWQGGSSSHRYLLWPAWLAFRYGFFFNKLCGLTSLPFVKILKGSIFHILCSWGSSGALLHASCLGGFKSVQISIFPPSNSSIVPHGKLSWFWNRVYPALIDCLWSYPIGFPMSPWSYWSCSALQ